MKGVALVMLAAIVVANFMVGPSEGVVACNQINSALAPCLTYLTKGGAPSSQCCAGVKNVNSMATTKVDRQVACNCLKQVSSRYKNIRDDAAVSLPRKCSIQVSIPISRNTDCTKIS